MNFIEKIVSNLFINAGLKSHFVSASTINNSIRGKVHSIRTSIELPSLQMYVSGFLKKYNILLSEDSIISNEDMNNVLNTSCIMDEEFISFEFVNFRVAIVMSEIEQLQDTPLEHFIDCNAIEVIQKLTGHNDISLSNLAKFWLSHMHAFLLYVHNEIHQCLSCLPLLLDAFDLQVKKCGEDVLLYKEIDDEFTYEIWREKDRPDFIEFILSYMQDSFMERLDEFITGESVRSHVYSVMYKNQILIHKEPLSSLCYLNTVNPELVSGFSKESRISQLKHLAHR